MTEPTLTGGGPDSASAPICPWCSATLATGQEETCPSCGAALRETAQSEVPGVTRVDVEAILKARSATPRSRGLMGWLSGEYSVEGPPESHGGIAPPDEAVRREMLRIEMAALEVEVQARQAEVAAEFAEAHGTTVGQADDGSDAAGDPGAPPDGDAPSGGAGVAAPVDAPAADAPAAGSPVAETSGSAAAAAAPAAEPAAAAQPRRSRKAKPG